MTSHYLVCGQCRHFTGKPHPLVGPLWKLCSATQHGVMADTTAAEHCERFLPPRIQLRRTKGWRKPDGAVVVARPSRWGNPFVLERRDDWFDGNVWLVVDSRDDTILDYGEREFVTNLAIEEYRRALLASDLRVTIEDVRRELRGKALCCWCRLVPGERDLCHAAVLLEVANEDSSRR